MGTTSRSGQHLIDFQTGLPKLFIDWLRQVYR